MIPSGNAVLLKKQNVNNYLSILSIVVLIFMFTLINNNFLSFYNVSNILADMATLLIISSGVTFVLLLGSIDLGIGSVASFSSVLFVLLFPRFGILAYLISLMFGLFAGWLNGILNAKIGIPSFIVTLGAMSVWKSAAFLLVPAPIMIPVNMWPDISWARSKIGIVPVSFIVAMVIVSLLYIFQNKTKTGKSAYAIGVNERAARIAGIDIPKVKIKIFMICGLCSAMTGILLATKLRSGIPNVGGSFSLMGVAAATLGGTAITGGKGGVLGTILGVGLVTVIQNGMNVVGVGAFWQQIVFGSLVILSVVMTVDRRGRDSSIK